jgi:beta-glucosidase
LVLDAVKLQSNGQGDVFVREGSAYLDPSLSIDARLDDLMAHMSLEEKAAQLDIVDWGDVRGGGRPYLGGLGIGSVLARLFGYEPWQAAEALSRIQETSLNATYLGIPILVGSDCPLGASLDGGTIFPCGIAMAGTWDPGLIQTVGAVIAQESRAVGIHQNYGPVLDICRDPRWGRVEESPGEDPFLASSFGRAMVEGLQSGARGESTEMIATPKHFAAYARIIGGRNGTSTSVSERELREIYLPPFEAAIAEAGANSIMTAYSELNGTPCVASPWLLRTILRDEWGFEGFVTTDWECVEDLVREFSVAASDEEAAALAMNAGADLHMLDTSGGRLYESYLISAVKSGKIEIPTLDAAVRRVLRQKFELGLFENPFSDADAARQTVGASENEEVALRVAQESLVLLKNDRGVLPLSDSQRVVLVPLNDDG